MYTFHEMAGNWKWRVPAKINWYTYNYSLKLLINNKYKFVYLWFLKRISSTNEFSFMLHKNWQMLYVVSMPYHYCVIIWVFLITIFTFTNIFFAFMDFNKMIFYSCFVSGYSSFLTERRMNFLSKSSAVYMRGIPFIPAEANTVVSSSGFYHFLITLFIK